MPKRGFFFDLTDKLENNMETYANGKGVAKYLVTREGGMDVTVEPRKV